MSHTITRLPYMGAPKADDTRHAAYKSMEIPMAKLHDHHREEVEHELTSFGDPLTTLIRKVERLAKALNCSEEEAEAILFNRI